MNDNALIPWLLAELQDRGWSQSELARRANYSTTAVNQIVTEQRPPTAEFCVAIARALRLPPEDVLRRAGHLPPQPTKAGLDAQAEYLISETYRLMAQLPEAAQRRVANAAYILAEAHAAAIGIIESQENHVVDK